MFKKRTIWIILAMIIGLSACGGNDALMVEEIWGRSSPMAAENGAFYMVITNNTNEDEQLLAVASAACSTAELHEMYMRENDVMGMRPVPGGAIDISAEETVALKVGGLHVMCLGKTQAFNAGDEIPLTLTFANYGEMEVTAEIRDN